MNSTLRKVKQCCRMPQERESTEKNTMALLFLVVTKKSHFALIRLFYLALARIEIFGFRVLSHRAAFCPFSMGL